MRNLRGRAVAAVLLAMGLASGLVLVEAGPALAANLVVTNGNDTGAAGQLRQVVAAANPGDVISFAVPTVALTQGEILLNKNLTLRGNGPGVTTITRLNVAPDFRIFQVATGVTVTIDLVTITGGQSPMDDQGAGILNLGTLTLSRSVLVGNVLEDLAGTGAGAGIANRGTATLTNTQVLNNVIVDDITFNAQGAGIHNTGTMTLMNTEVAFNNILVEGPGTSGYGGGIYQGAGQAAVSLTIIDSVVSDNTITAELNAQGGGIASLIEGLQGASILLQRSIVRDNDATGEIASGGGMLLSGPSTVDRMEVTGNTAAAISITESEGGGLSVVGDDLVTVTNSTFAQNRADEGSAIYGGDGGQAINLRITNTTIAGNFSVPGAALDSDNAIAQLQNTILNNPNSAAECAGSIQDLGNNLWFGASQGTCPASFTNADPKLLSLGISGGTNATMAPDDGSAAIDAGAGCPGIDQRGFPRPAGAACDIGAHERDTVLVDITPPACNAATPVFINPKQMDVTVTDATRGLSSITNVSITNGTFITPFFLPGTPLPVKIAAVKINQAQSTSFSFRPVDQAGNNKLCS